MENPIEMDDLGVHYFGNILEGSSFAVGFNPFLKNISQLGSFPRIGMDI